jgi:hypothetical protein
LRTFYVVIHMSKTFISILVIILVVIIAAGVIIGFNGAGLTNNYGYNVNSNASGTLAINNSNINASSTTASSTLSSKSASSTSSVARNSNKSSNGKSGSNSTANTSRTNSNTITPGVPSAGGPVSTVPRGFIYIYSSGNNPLVVDSGSKNLPVLKFTVQSPAENSANLSELILGSDQNNTLFNYLENFRVFTSSGYPVSVLDYTYRLNNWRPIFKLTSPLTVPANQSVEYLITADLKPGVSNVTISPMQIYGGSGNMVISSNAEGSSITVR